MMLEETLLNYQFKSIFQQTMPEERENPLSLLSVETQNYKQQKKKKLKVKSCYIGEATKENVANI